MKGTPLKSARLENTILNCISASSKIQMVGVLLLLLVVQPTLGLIFPGWKSVSLSLLRIGLSTKLKPPSRLDWIRLVDQKIQHINAPKLDNLLLRNQQLLRLECLQSGWPVLSDSTPWKQIFFEAVINPYHYATSRSSQFQQDMGRPHPSLWCNMHT